jgi:anti-sigma B factor antagonist
MDTAGLGTLLSFCIKLRRAGGNVVLASVSPAHIEVVLLMKLETVFEVFADERDAIGSFFPDRAIKPFDLLKFVQSQNRAARPAVS